MTMGQTGDKNRHANVTQVITSSNIPVFHQSLALNNGRISSEKSWLEDMTDDKSVGAS